MKKILILMALSLALTGCAKGPPKTPVPGVPFSGGVQHVVRDILSGYKGFLEEAKVNHPECNPDLRPANEDNRICQAIWRAIASHQTVHTLLGVYCTNPAWAAGDRDAVCTPPAAGEGLAQLQTRLFQAVADLGSLINSVKEITR